MQVCYIPLAQWPLVSDFFTSPLVNNLYCCVATYEALPASNTDALHLGVKIFDIMAGYQAETGLDPGHLLPSQGVEHENEFKVSLQF